MFTVTKQAMMDPNGLANFTSGILTNEELNLDTATRMSLQDAVPELSKTVKIPGSEEKVGINSLRKGGKRNPDLNRVYGNDLDPEYNRQLYQTRREQETSKTSRHGKNYSAVTFLPPSPNAKSPPRKKRDTSCPTVVDLVSEKNEDPEHSTAQGGVSDTPASSFEDLRPFRMAIVARMKDMKQMSSEDKKNLRRVYGILSGVQCELSQTIVTIAFDSVGFDDQWMEPYKLNKIIDIMLSFF